ncbi:MAG: hypothetical protein LBB16_04325 [Puniceicoccales bacterium]|nr:hypothetical protein [Puniceicoccales bacterium]
MKTDITSALQRFQSLSIKQKTISIVLLCLASLVLLNLSIVLITSFPKKIHQVHSLYDEQKVWFSQSDEIEKELSSFTESGTGLGKLDLPKVTAAIEKITAKTGVQYTFTKLEKGDIEQLTIHRYKVSFDRISLSGLIEFSNQIEALDNNVAISEIQISAQGQLLDAYCIISILDTK